MYNLYHNAVHKVIELISLEGRYGSPPGYSPIIKTVLTYLDKVMQQAVYHYNCCRYLPLIQLVGSMEEQDCQMRSLIYLMLSRDGGQESQKVQ